MLMVTNGFKNRENNLRTIFSDYCNLSTSTEGFFVCLLENVLQKIGAIEMENL